MKGNLLSFVYMHPMMKRPLAIDFESFSKKNLTEGDDDDVMQNINDHTQAKRKGLICKKNISSSLPFQIFQSLVICDI